MKPIKLASGSLIQSWCISEWLSNATLSLCLMLKLGTAEIWSSTRFNSQAKARDKQILTSGSIEWALWTELPMTCSHSKRTTSQILFLLLIIQKLISVSQIKSGENGLTTKLPISWLSETSSIPVHIPESLLPSQWSHGSSSSTLQTNLLLKIKNKNLSHETLQKSHNIDFYVNKKISQ